MRLLAETAWWDLCMAGTVTVGCVLALIFGLSFAFDRLGLPHEFLVPTAFLALLVPVVFMGFFKRLRKRPRYSAGHCRVCGYNLTGNVTGICPECGTSFGLGVICECCEKMVYFHPDKQGTFQTCPHCGDVSEVPRMPSAADRSSEQSPPTTPP